MRAGVKWLGGAVGLAVAVAAPATVMVRSNPITGSIVPDAPEGAYFVSPWAILAGLNSGATAVIICSSAAASEAAGASGGGKNAALPISANLIGVTGLASTGAAPAVEGSGCVLPALDPPVAGATSSVVDYPLPAPLSGPPFESPLAFGLLPLLLGAGAVAGAGAGILALSGGGGKPNSPV